MIIYITGFMAVGKTVIGKELAQLLNCKFIDLDQSIEDHSGLSIDEMFRTGTEQAFREAESLVLKKLIRQVHEPTIISLGGGTICSDENLQIILGSGICIYLKATYEEIRQNLPYLMQNRPLFEGLSESEAENKLVTLFSNREAYYSKSQLETPINTGFSAKKLANILKLLTNRSQPL